ncbi:hypothetical protein PoB_006005900 [Plakobranchus ocellatus]|uniref:Uncharacterized protein n=1 Tax=Plakobranchus ocellatus TaxID=259542 RepID=A0AAV4CNX3_9GAST|nr:hypothetical protein PoB_006005900 [Plakobranchus ocellatus]
MNLTGVNTMVTSDSLISFRSRSPICGPSEALKDTDRAVTLPYTNTPLLDDAIGRRAPSTGPQVLNVRACATLTAPGLPR